MTIPSTQILMLPVLKLGTRGEVRVSDAVELLSDEFSLTPEERKQLASSSSETKMRSRVGWAIHNLVQAKLLRRPKRGYFTITKRGREVLASSPAEISREFLMQFPEYVEKIYDKSSRTSATDAGKGESSTPEEQIDSAYAEITAALRKELLDKVLEGTPEFFERLIVKLFVKMGYGGSLEDAGEHVGRSGDEGVDGIIKEDRLGLDLLYLQAKRYAPGNSVGRPDIQKFAGSLLGKGANKGIFVTTSCFSEQAKSYAENVPQRLVLIDGEELAGLMLEHGVGVRKSYTVELKKIDEDFFEQG